MGSLSAVILYLSSLVSPQVDEPIDTGLVEEYTIGEFHRATRVIINADGQLFIIDADQNKIYLFPNSTKQPKSIGGFGWSSTTFDKPTGIATDGVNVYVSDYGNHRIQRFDRNLNFISSFSTRDTTDLSVRFGYPVDISLSELGDLFLLDGENLRVLKFNPLYYFERSFGDINAKDGRLYNPVKLIASSSRVFVGERDRIAVYDYFGNFLCSIGKGLISELVGFAISDNGIVVALSDTLIWFTMEGTVQKRISLKEVLTSDRIDRIQDIACHGNRLYLLAPNKLYLIKIND
jgi:hypothetical protein